MQISQELQNRIKELIRKDGRCVIETSEDKTLLVKAYPKAKRIKKEVSQK